MSGRYRLAPPPRRLQRVHLDNLALVSGDLLPYKDKWQEVANRLPRRAILIVLSQHNELQKQTMLRVAKILAKEGHQIRVMPATELSRRHPVSPSSEKRTESPTRPATSPDNAVSIPR